MSKKYICYGGYVRSVDGDEHYIAATRLPDLYNVNPQECIFYRDGHTLRGYTKEALDKMVALYPQDDGDYTFEAKP